MEASQDSPSPEQPSYIFLSKELIEIHLLRSQPLPEGTTEMIALIHKMLGNPETTEGGW